MNKRRSNLRKHSKALAGLPVLSQIEIAARWKLGPDTVRKLIKVHNIPTAPGPWKRARYVISDIWRVEGVCKTRSNIGPRKRLRFAVVAE